MKEDRAKSLTDPLPYVGLVDKFGQSLQPILPRHLNEVVDKPDTNSIQILRLIIGATSKVY